MRSKANFRGHPSHPALVPFPFAFMTGAFFFDLTGHLLNRPSWWTTGANLAVAGVAFGLLAAIPGIIDYVYTVPPRSTGKKRATKHMILNIAAMGLFALARWLRGDATIRPEIPTLGLEGIATACLFIAGWMGGTLVSRNQVSVDHRYAKAGKWRDVKAEGDGSNGVIVRMKALELNQMCLVRAGERRLVLARTEDGYVAFDDHCTHRGGSLAGGVLICGTVQCPWHGSQFDVKTGQVKCGPAEKPIASYRVDADGERFRIFA